MHIDIETAIKLLEKMYPETVTFAEYPLSGSPSHVLAEMYETQGMRKIITSLKELQTGKFPNVQELLK